MTPIEQGCKPKILFVSYNLLFSNDYYIYDNNYQQPIGYWKFDCASRNVQMLLFTVSTELWIPSISATTDCEKWLSKEILSEK